MHSYSLHVNQIVIAISDQLNIRYRIGCEKEKNLISVAELNWSPFVLARLVFSVWRLAA